MSAVVCGKRSSSVFDEIPYHHSPKRSRCGLSPARDPLAHLRSLFPLMNQEILERALEASGNDLDSAIKSLTGLSLKSDEINLASVTRNLDNGIPTNDHLANEGIGSSNGCNIEAQAETLAAGVENNNCNINLPSDGSEWVELFVREMTNASDMDDARARASSALQVLENSILSRSGGAALQTIQKENVTLKEQVGALVRENTILKRAVAIQHERQREHEEGNQELHHLKQLVSQYQDQVRTLEVNNYALTMHLRQAQQGNSIPGRFHPDIF